MKPNKFVYIIVVLLAIFLRFYQLSQAPVFNDELDVGNQAYSLLKTAKDYSGNFLPSYIQSFEENRAPLLMYISIPAIKLFGLNIFSLKLTSIVLSFLVAFYFYKTVSLFNKSIAQIATGLLLLTPYFTHYNRNAFEVTLLLLLTISATFYYLKYCQNHININLYLSVILFGLTFYTYNTSNVFTPLLVICLLILNRQILKKINMKTLSIAILLAILLLSPIIGQIKSGQASARFSQISIFTDGQTLKEIIEKRTLFPQSNSTINRLVYNRPVYYLKNFLNNYLQALSLNTLFVTGDPNPRHTPPGSGLFPYIYAPLLILGILLSLKTNKKGSLLFLIWLLIAPIASCLTQSGGTHATRLSYLIIPVVYFVSLALYRIKSTIFKLALIVLLIANLSSWYYQYFTHYPKEQFKYWHNLYLQTLQNIPADYNNLYISDTDYANLKPFVFVKKIDPINLQTNFSNQAVTLKNDLTGFVLNNNNFVSNWQQLDVLDKVQTIGQPADVFVLYQKNDIPGDYDLTQNPLKNFTTIKTIRDPNDLIFSQIIKHD